MTDAFFWPHTILKPRDVVRRLRARTTIGTTSASGFTQRVSVPAHAWVIEYSGVLIHTPDQLRNWDVVEGLLDGGANPIYVPLVGDDYGPINGSFTFAQSAGTTFFTLTRVGAPILGGDHFTVGDGRLHRVISAANVPGTDAYDVHIRPPLRDDYPVGEAIGFQTPFCKCRLQTDEEMNITITPGRYAVGAVKFVEDAGS